MTVNFELSKEETITPTATIKNGFYVGLVLSWKI